MRIDTMRIDVAKYSSVSRDPSCSSPARKSFDLHVSTVYIHCATTVQLLVKLSGHTFLIYQPFKPLNKELDGEYSGKDQWILPLGGILSLNLFSQGGQSCAKRLILLFVACFSLLHFLVAVGCIRLVKTIFIKKIVDIFMSSGQS